MTSKLKGYGGWNTLSKEARLARVMYPHLAEPVCQREMAALARQEGKRPPVYVGPDEPMRRQQPNGRR